MWSMGLSLKLLQIHYFQNEEKDMQLMAIVAS